MKKQDFMRNKRTKRRNNRIKRRKKKVNNENGEDKSRRVNEQPKLLNKITFSFYNTDPPSIRVEGVPPSLRIALARMNAATEVVVRMFMDKAKEGLLNENYDIIEQDIIPVQGGLVGLDGNKLQ